jgi:2-polyprenyl-3-methyl-5-hydroxy-6-metoxy-1,4-benzoquinol methylase
MNCPSPQSAEEFWQHQYAAPSIAALPASISGAVDAALAFFGPMQGKRVLDIGCGTGGTSLRLARSGAKVTALDYSRNAVDNLNRHVDTLGIDNLTAVCGDAMQIDSLGRFDCVFGSLILHHLEPFGDFCRVLRRSLVSGGRGFFLENNASSSLLLWFRQHIVGKLWVPRYGDGVEFPLTPAEINELRRYFALETEIPEMIFFQLVSSYLLNRMFMNVTRAIDATLFRMNLGTKYSYLQHLMIRG